MSDGAWSRPSHNRWFGARKLTLVRQLEGAAIVSAYSFVVALILAFVIQKTIGFRASPEAEVDGIDLAEHAESGYDLAPAGGGSGFALAGVGGAHTAGGNAATPAPAEGQPTEKVPG